GLFHGARALRLRAVREQEIEQGGHVVLGHGIHGRQREGDVAGLRVEHGLEIILEAIHAPGQAVQVALDLEQGFETEAHRPTPRGALKIYPEGGGDDVFFPGMQAIVAENLIKSYGKGPKAIKAVDGVSISVRQGEIFGLLGPNGAGKSTTVRMLATLTRPDGGKARVADCDVIADPAAARRRIGYVAQ